MREILPELFLHETAHGVCWENPGGVPGRGTSKTGVHFQQGGAVVSVQGTALLGATARAVGEIKGLRLDPYASLRLGEFSKKTRISGDRAADAVAATPEILHVEAPGDG
jgi:hypothetical protein